ncbi:reverse transcriptase domain-containing protein [Paenibacillus sp. 2TAB26]|uniref:reverse transcriptase domain-containing protein n=1 Tax=Paenibacillus sp. 2TAB26 TaxID=3233005 RepID=UPI003F9805E8
MTDESEGRQPVVALKQGNACGAKGHSQFVCASHNTCRGSRCAYLTNVSYGKSFKEVVALAQKFDYPKSENDLRTVIDTLYAESKRAIENDDLPRFKGLLEIMSAETTILKAIHKIKANRGSNTPGSDGEVMRENILEKDYEEIIARVQNGLLNYRPLPVLRVFIPKPGKTEKRPLGIPAIIDRIIQECVRMVIEPILEAQFFRYSYGFRPMRDAHMAIGKLTTTIHRTGHHWIIEGDISKFFDNVNHSILLKKLWHMGIRDRRVLMIIKGMLNAGIMDELKVNPLGTPQGGIISPLLANAYLDTFDQWVTREWENKKLRTSYSDLSNKRKAMRKTNLKPAYLVRYADDWVLVTASKSSAEKWKRRIAKFLDVKLKLKLSEEKTLITNVSKKSIHFVGFKQKVVIGNSRKGWVPRIRPNPE